MKKLIYVQPRILFYQFRLSPTYPMVGAAHAVSGMPVAQRNAPIAEIQAMIDAHGKALGSPLPGILGVVVGLCVVTQLKTASACCHWLLVSEWWVLQYKADS